MQVKNIESTQAIEQDHKVNEAHKSHDATESNKTHDVKKQAEEQQDKGQNWQKFAQNNQAAAPPSVSDVAASKQVEAGREINRIDIEAKLRENSIKA